MKITIVGAIGIIALLVVVWLLLSYLSHHSTYQGPEQDPV